MYLAILPTDLLALDRFSTRLVEITVRRTMTIEWLGTSVGFYCFSTKFFTLIILPGNIEADDDGIANIALEDRQVKLIGPHSIIGRSIVIKSNEDDLGKGGHETSLISGNSGQKIAGGVVGIASS